jgi:heterodisulfide reductase subunit A-like polyferredoxin
MPHALTELGLAEVTRPATEPGHEIRADVYVVGAGIAGLSAAIESARLHRDVLLVDSLPLIGGQMVHSLVELRLCRCAATSSRGRRAGRPGARSGGRSGSPTRT